MSNRDLAAIFDEMAALMTLEGASSFRVGAYERVARILGELDEPVTDMVARGDDLKSIDGIGDGSARRIVEWVETGAIADHEKLRARVPAGLVDVLRLPGLGPKTVQALWKDADVTDLASLRAAIDAGRLEGLPRMGAKSIAKILDAIESTLSRTSERTRLDVAMPIAEAIVERLRDVEGTTRIAYAGSLRRGRETIGDIDVLACSAAPERLSETLRSMPMVERVLAAGETKSSVRLARGIQVDLRVIGAASWGAAQLYFSGSKEHNVRLRERAQKMGFRLNEYGLFPEDGETAAPQTRGIAPVAAATEEEIYAALELPWIPPELREDRGEIDLAERGAIPDLITLDDIVAELHAHTTASDGRLSIEELAREAMRRGLTVLAITDHSPASASGVPAADMPAHIAAIRDVNARLDGITLLAGAEVDILADGRLDYPDELLEELDLVVASPHVALRQDPAQATARLLRAIEHPSVDILGHPTGRLIGRRDGIVPDLPTLCAAAAEHDVALEINANGNRLDLRDTHVRTALAAGAKIAINTDAHAAEDFDHLRYGVMTARRGGVTKVDCVNTRAGPDRAER